MSALNWCTPVMCFHLLLSFWNVVTLTLHLTLRLQARSEHGSTWGTRPWTSR